MKKIFKRTLTVALSALLLASGLAMTVSARNTKADCAYGTAVVDGKLDAAYLNTEYTETIRAKVFHCPINGCDITQANYPVRATTYFCWDENYFYTCTVVKDAEVFAQPREYYDTPWPWQDDGVEIWYVRNDESFSLHTDGSGVIWYAYSGTSADKNPWADVPTVGVFAEPAYDNFDCTSKKATTLTEDGYIIETALAIKDGSKYAAGDVIKCSLQVIDLMQSPENGNYGYAIGSQDPYNQGVTLTLAEPTDPVVTGAPVTDAPVTDILDNPNVVTDDKGNAGELVTDDKGSTVTDDAGAVVTKPVETKPAGSTTTTGGGNKNPNTSDMGVVAAAAVLVSGLAYATVKLTSKKRH